MSTEISRNDKVVILVAGTIIVILLVTYYTLGILERFSPPQFHINIQRDGPEEWLPLVQSLESFVPTPIVDLEGLYGYSSPTFCLIETNITSTLERETYNLSTGDKLYLNYQARFNVSDTINIIDVLLTVSFNSSYWRHFHNYRTGFDSPIGWLVENGSEYYLQRIHNQSSFLQELNPYFQNISASLEQGESFFYMLQEWESERYVMNKFLWFNNMGRLVLATITGHVILMILIYASHYSNR
ncbi:MAG: hypothetical protein ACFFCZ_27250 [Promethearchaeota archaeon]